MFWKWGGKNIKIYGNGVLNGNGQRWWNEFAGKEILDKTNQYLRPILFYAENATGLDIQGIHFKDSPCWTNFVVTCKYPCMQRETSSLHAISKGHLFQGRCLHGALQQRHVSSQEHRLF
jgi:hypothetical protein